MARPSSTKGPAVKRGLMDWSKLQDQPRGACPRDTDHHRLVAFPFLGSERAVAMQWNTFQDFGFARSTQSLSAGSRNFHTCLGGYVHDRSVSRDLQCDAGDGELYLEGGQVSGIVCLWGHEPFHAHTLDGPVLTCCTHRLQQRFRTAAVQHGLPVLLTDRREVEKTVLVLRPDPWPYPRTSTPNPLVSWTISTGHRNKASSRRRRLRRPAASAAAA